MRDNQRVRCVCCHSGVVVVALLMGCNKPVEHRVAQPLSAPSARQHATGSPMQEIVVKPFVAAGERLVLALRMYDIVLGRIEMRAGRPGTIGGEPAIIMWTETRTDGALRVFVQLREQVTTTLSRANGLPMTTTGSFDGLFRNLNRPPSKRTWTRGSRRIHNVHTAYAALRAWDPPPGSRGFVRGRVGHRHHQMLVTAAGREILRTKSGPKPVVRYEGIVRAQGARSRGLRFVLWLTDDRDRSLFRLRTETELGGTVEARQVAYSRPD